MVTGMPLRMDHVSGLWQYRQRHMHPAVHATTRMPGPSTADPVVKECRNPMSPVASAVLTSDSGTPSPRLTRSSYGLLAPSDTCAVPASSPITASSAGDRRPPLIARLLRPVERTIDDVHLLLA